MTPKEILKKYYGYDSFREGQEELIASILKGQDAFGIMPTGAGKSVCYQVPALAMEGIAIVISPLISLMKDQVTFLNQAGIHAAYINSSLTAGQSRKALEYAKQGRYKIIYVAPERLETESFCDFAFCETTKISMVAVDEAHCISQWGQDFRPSYLKIVEFIDKFKKRPVVCAFTATATEAVKEDVMCILKLNQPKVVTTGFDRKNLYYEVRRSKQKDAEILNYVMEHKDMSGIIYCATRKNVEAVYEMLLEKGLPVTKYHAGLSDAERKQNQDDFIYDTAPIMVATNAFGMGIDKSNVRYVLHYNMPKNIDSLYQEMGRCSRDGERGECILFYSPQDVMIQKYMIENGTTETEEISYEDRQLIKERDLERLNKVNYYCVTKNCLHSYILNYFGEYDNGNCENCSNCLGEFEEIDVTEISRTILACIDSCRQRYGINVYVGVLRGRKIAKLISYGLDTNPYFGALSDVSEERIRQIINHLLTEQYLYLTNDKYTLVKINRSANEILEGRHTVTLKCAKEEPQKADTQSGASLAEGTSRNRKASVSEILTSKGLDLFDELKALRTEIAREEAVPPYIVFSDKTLIDMCMKLPFSKEEMLNVSGIGEHKFEKYGARFLAAIQHKTGGQKIETAYMTVEEKDRYTAVSRKKSVKMEFAMTEEIKAGIAYKEQATISELVEQINELREKDTMKRLVIKDVTAHLIEEGYIEEKAKPGFRYYEKRVTEKGTALGMTEETRISDKGNEYVQICCSENTQKFIVEHIIKEKMSVPVLH